MIVVRGLLIFALLCAGCDPSLGPVAWEMILPREASIRPWAALESPKRYSAAHIETCLKDRARVAQAYGVKEMVRVYYHDRDRPARRMTVDVLAFGALRDSFGYYSRDRSRARPKEIETLGTQGFSQPDLVEVFSGKFVLRCQANSPSPDMWAAMMMISAMIADRLPAGSQKWPVELDLFPPEGLRADSQQYVRPALLDQEYLGEGWLAEYRYRGLDYQLLLVPCQFPLAVANKLARLREYLQRFGKLTPTPARLGADALAGEEATLGRVLAVGVRSWALIVVNCPDAEVAARLLLAAADRLRQYPEAAGGVEHAPVQ